MGVVAGPASSYLLFIWPLQEQLFMAIMVSITDDLGSAVFYAMKTIELGDARNTRRWVIQSPPAEAIMSWKRGFW